MQKVSKFHLWRHKARYIETAKREELSQSGIYCILNIKNENKYIGQSVNIFHRWKDHKRDLEKNSHYNPHLQNAWNSYGGRHFKLLIMEFCEKGVLDHREQYWINTLEPEYNIVMDIFEPSLYWGMNIPKNTDYMKAGESFTRPIWHLWVYAGQKKPRD